MPNTPLGAHTSGRAFCAALSLGPVFAVRRLLYGIRRAMRRAMADVGCTAD